MKLLWFFSCLLMMCGVDAADATTQSDCVAPPSPVAAPNATGVPCRVERRAAIDVGSGSIKLLISDLKICGGKIEEVKNVDIDPKFRSQKLDFFTGEDTLRGAFCKQGEKNKTPFQIRPETQTAVIRLLNEIKSYATCRGATTYVGVATHATRVAERENQRAFAERIRKETGFEISIEATDNHNTLSGIRVVTQDTEGRLAHAGALRALKDTSCNTHNSVVWDIGGGSSQIVKQGSPPPVGKLEFGAGCFQQRVLQKNKSLRFVPMKCAASGGVSTFTPNPIGGPKDVASLIEDAKKMIKENSPKNFNKSLKDFRGPNKCIVGVGGLHNFAVYEAIRKNWSRTACADEPLPDEKTEGRVFTKRQVVCLANYLASKSEENDEEFCKNPFSTTNVTNLILMAGFMEFYGLNDSDRVRAVDVNPTNQLFYEEEIISAPFAETLSTPALTDKASK